MKKAPKQPTTARDTLFSYLFGSDDVAGKKIVDLFAGGGGVSLGIEMALGRSPDVAINHDEEAIAMHQQNHPNTRHYRSDVFEVDPHEAVGDSPVALPARPRHSTAPAAPRPRPTAASSRPPAPPSCAPPSGSAPGFRVRPSSATRSRWRCAGTTAPTSRPCCSTARWT